MIGIKKLALHLDTYRCPTKIIFLINALLNKHYNIGGSDQGDTEQLSKNFQSSFRIKDPELKFERTIV